LLAAAPLALLAALAPAAAAGVPPVVEGQVKIAAGLQGFVGPLGPDDVFGSSVADIGDLDGNGVDDLAVGAPTSSSPPGGAVWILFRDVDGSVLSAARIDALSAGLPLDASDDFGRSLAFLEDHDGDGNPELAVGAPNFGPGNLFGAGAVFVLSLLPDGTVLQFTQLAEGVGPVPLPKTFTGFGYALAAIDDLDADGLPELAVSDTVGVTGQPVVWILGLDPDSTAHSATAFTGADPVFGGLVASGDRFGQALSAVPDLDGDGLQELAIGAPATGSTEKGAVYIAYLQPGPVIFAVRRIAEGESGFSGPLENGAQFGGALAGGDLDGDGLPDLVVGAPFSANAGGTTTGAGSLWTLALDAGAQVLSQAQIEQDLAGFNGPLGPDDQFGCALALLPDVEGSNNIVAGARGTGGSYIFAPGAIWDLDIAYHQAWQDLGNALAGTNGPPLLEGHGVLSGGSVGDLNLSQGVPNGHTNLFVGIAAINHPLKGGVLVPAPNLVFFGLPLDRDGSLTLPFVWPTGIPSGFAFYFQHWMADPGGPLGFAASNAVQGTTP
jgi:hypothetical protein